MTIKSIIKKNSLSSGVRFGQQVASKQHPHLPPPLPSTAHRKNEIVMGVEGGGGGGGGGVEVCLQSPRQG